MIRAMIAILVMLGLSSLASGTEGKQDARVFLAQFAVSDLVALGEIERATATHPNPDSGRCDMLRLRVRVVGVLKGDSAEPVVSVGVCAADYSEMKRTHVEERPRGIVFLKRAVGLVDGEYQFIVTDRRDWFAEDSKALSGKLSTAGRNCLSSPRRKSELTCEASVAAAQAAGVFSRLFQTGDNPDVIRTVGNDDGSACAIELQSGPQQVTIVIDPGLTCSPLVARPGDSRAISDSLVVVWQRSHDPVWLDHSRLAFLWDSEWQLSRNVSVMDLGTERVNTVDAGFPVRSLSCEAGKLRATGAADQTVELPARCGAKP